MIALASLRRMADCLMILLTMSLSSTSIHRIGEDSDILDDTILMLMSVNFSLCSRNSDANAFWCHSVGVGLDPPL